MAATFSFSLRDKWGLGAAAGVALCLGLGGWAYNSMGSSSSNANAAPMRPQQTASKATGASLTLPAGGGETVTATGETPVSSAAANTLVVHVTGSVKNPGVYKLKPGDRINDAVKAAGGFKTNAQQDALNLADTVQDADQIFVPAQQAPQAAAKAKTGQISNAPAYSDTAPVYVSAPPRRPLIIRGTPVTTAIASAVRSAPAAVSSVSPAQSEAVPGAALAVTPDAAAGGEESTPAPNVPVHQGRVLGKPTPVAAFPEGDESAGENNSDPQETAPAAGGAPSVYSPVTKTSKSRTTRSTSSGSVRRTGGPAVKAGGTAAKFKNPGDGVVHLNSAGAAELEKLPGVGPAMSGRILEYRHQIGGFKSIEQILDINCALSGRRNDTSRFVATHV